MNYSATKVPEHLKSGGIPPFSGCIHDTNTACLLAIQLLLLFLNFLVRKAITFWTIPPFSPTVDLDSQKKEKKNTSQMRLGSVFKMRMSILNTATTEHLGCILFSFFVYIKSINQDFSLQMPLPTLLVSYNRLDKCNVNYCFLEKVNKSQKLRVVV